jgi:hypothetical protein
MSRTFSVSVSGIEAVRHALNPAAVTRDIDRITETYARKMANEAAENAPRDTGRLKNSFPSSVQKESEGLWSFGSDVPYAAKQEYEHRTKKGFVRKAVWNNREAYRSKIKERLDEIGR